MEQLKKDTAIIICSRIKSRRIPEKPFKLVRGRTVLDRLLDRISGIGIPIIIAVPNEDAESYAQFQHRPNVLVETGSESDPLARMHKVAQKHGLKNIIRITHDKIFVDPSMIIEALRKFRSRKDSHSCMYMFSTKLPAGTGFEICRYSLLARAAAKFTNVEHLSYALKAMLEPGEEAYNFIPPVDYQSNARLLIDYPADLQLMELLFMECGEHASMRHAITWIENNRWTREINRLPDVTVYTCGYNADKYLNAAMASVYQNMETESFINDDSCRIEYIIIDDSSTDSTYMRAMEFAHNLPNVRVIKNQINLGLASSSNIALDEAKGSYIVRLDSDDMFISHSAISALYKEITSRGLDAVYPGFYRGDLGTVEENPQKEHHVGGAMFSVRALNHIRFTDGLRGYEGLDLYLRAVKQLNIGYYRKPLWFYRTRDDSMSNTNLEKRAKMKAELLEKYD